MKSTEMSTRWRSQFRLEMRALVWERQPWKRHSKAAIAAAYQRCTEDARHNAMVALGLQPADLEVIDVGTAEGAAPSDADGGEEVGEELEVLAGGVGDGDVIAHPHEPKIDSKALRVL